MTLQRFFCFSRARLVPTFNECVAYGSLLQVLDVGRNEFLEKYHIRSVSMDTEDDINPENKQTKKLLNRAIVLLLLKRDREMALCNYVVMF